MRKFPACLNCTKARPSNMSKLNPLVRATICAGCCETAKQSSGLNKLQKLPRPPKTHTTRFAIHGVVHDPRGQIVFVDTPGVLERTRDAVSRTMSEHINAALAGIDAVVYVADPTRPIGAEEKRALK